MRILGVGGCSKGVGKTLLIARLVEVLPGWGVLKTSPAHPARGRPSERAHGPAAPYEVVTDPAELTETGADTERYVAAGARRVVWLRAHPERLAEGMARALAAFGGLEGVVVEGNSFARFVEPERFVLVARAGSDEIKASAIALVPRADWIVLNAPAGSSPGAVLALESRLLRDLGGRRVEVLDVAAPASGALANFLEEIRDWARWPA